MTGGNDLSSTSSVAYDLIQVPVVSTFKPNKASPLTLQRNISSTSGFNNHLDFGFGNRDQLYFDLSNTFKNVKFCKINVDDNDLVNDYDIEYLPTIMVYSNDDMNNYIFKSESGDMEPLKKFLKSLS